MIIILGQSLFQQYDGLNVARVAIIDVSVLGNRSTVFSVFEVYGNISTILYSPREHINSNHFMVKPLSIA
ncbi:MAG: hypothetical protein ACOWWR_04420, partial [Eubacteriales bacterium]